MTPKYDTVEVALKRLQSHKGVLICGSATPAVSTYYRSEHGIFERLELTKRYNQTELPEVAIVDMRSELKAGNKTMISRALYRQMTEAFGEKKAGDSLS